MPSFWFKLEEAAGNRVDSIAGALLGPNGACTNAAGKILFGSEQAPINAPASTAFLGSAAPDPLLKYDGNGFDFFGWAMYQSNPGTNVDFIQINMLRAGSTLFGFTYRPSLAEIQVFVQGDGGLFETIVVPYVFSAGTWIFNRVFYDPVTTRFGVQIDNGIIYDSAAGYALVAGITGELFLTALRQNVNGTPFVARFDECGMFQQKLSTAQASVIWNGGAGSTFP